MTAKGFPEPAINADNANQDAIKAVADRLDAILSARTAAQINALTGSDLWTGRVERQTDGTGTTTRQQSGLYLYDSATWKPVVADGLAGTATGPVLTAATTNPAMGTSPTLAWNWWRLGGWVIGSIVIIWGTGSPTPGTGDYSITIPAAAAPWPGAASGDVVPIGSGVIKDVSLPASRDVIPIWIGSTTCQLIFDDSAATVVTGASPITLGAAGDYIKLDLMYPVP